MTEPLSPVDRRTVLDIAPNPVPKIDYLVTLAETVQERTLELRYVPDRWLLPIQHFASYVERIHTLAWDTPEALAAAVLDDVNNEIVPRWVQVRLSAVPGANPSHAVTMFDRQPKWDNKGLLDRVARI